MRPPFSSASTSHGLSSSSAKRRAIACQRAASASSCRYMVSVFRWGEVFGEYGGEEGEADAARLVRRHAVRAHEHVEPQARAHRGESVGDVLGIDVLVAAFFDELTAEREHDFVVLAIALRAELAI